MCQTQTDMLFKVLLSDAILIFSNILFVFFLLSCQICSSRICTFVHHGVAHFSVVGKWIISSKQIAMLKVPQM